MNKRKSFTTTIDREIQEKFKNTCSENKVTMSEILEVFMTEYSDGKYSFEIQKILKKSE